MFKVPLIVLGALLIALNCHCKRHGLLQIVPDPSNRQLLDWSRKVNFVQSFMFIFQYILFIFRFRDSSKGSLVKKSHTRPVVVIKFHQILGTNN